MPISEFVNPKLADYKLKLIAAANDTKIDGLRKWASDWANDGPLPYPIANAFVDISEMANLAANQDFIRFVGAAGQFRAACDALDSDNFEVLLKSMLFVENYLAEVQGRKLEKSRNSQKNNDRKHNENRSIKRDVMKFLKGGNLAHLSKSETIKVLLKTVPSTDSTLTSHIKQYRRVRKHWDVLLPGLVAATLALLSTRKPQEDAFTEDEVQEMTNLLEKEILDEALK